RSPAARLGRRVAELRDPGVAGQEGADHLPLDADTAAVDDAELAQALLVGRVEPGEDDVLHLPGREAVQVEHVGDRQLDGFSEVVEVFFFVHAFAGTGPDCRGILSGYF